MKTVILAEKPSQARSYIEAFKKSTKHDGYYDVTDPVLPADTVITYGFGHLVELATPDKYDAKYTHWSLSNLPIFPQHYQFVVGKDKAKQFKVVKGLLVQADTIIVATDSDREGENIAWSIMKQAQVDLQAKTIKRLWINSLEKQAVRDGFQHLRNGWDYYPKYQEAQTRQISDWLVGMNASPLYSLLLQQNGLHGQYSIGRVQTPTLYMVYQRDQALTNFKPQPFYELQATVATNQGNFDAKLDPHQRFDDEAGVQTFMRAQGLQAGTQPAVIKDVQKQVKHTLSPKLFSLSTLQSAINKQYHASASEVLAAVQALYEIKLLTYPRTDCNYITTAEFDYLVPKLSQFAAVINSSVNLTQVEPKLRYVDGQKVQEHHAIIMTKIVPTMAQLSKLPKLQQQVYDLVLRTTLAMFAMAYEYEETTVITQVSQADFKATGQVPKVTGWRELFKSAGTKADTANLLPAVAVGQTVQATIRAPQKMTTPPKPFTEGTLITAMKTAGKTLDANEAMVLKNVEGIGTEATRANVLEVLKRRGYLVTQKNQLHVSDAGVTLCRAVELEPILTSPSMTAKWELALQQIGEKKRTPENFLGQIKLLIQKLLKEVPTQFASDAGLKAQLADQQQRQQAAQVKAAVGVCPHCKTGEIADRGKFYGCSNYRQGCQFTLPKRWCGKTLSKTVIRDLITTGETGIIKGFKSKKTGKSFSAKLKLAAGKLAFEFN